MKKKMPLLVLSLLFLLLFTTCTHENDNQQVILNAVKDVDGNSYDAVRIGGQVWMKTNLRTKHFRDGSPIPEGGEDHWSQTKPYVYEPISDELGFVLDSKTYGLYYNWPVVADNRELCPKGWHVPSDSEWQELLDYVGSKNEFCVNNDPTAIAKALAAKEGWYSSPAEGTPGCFPEENNTTGFSAVPAGLWDICSEEISLNSFFWTSSSRNDNSAWCYILNCESMYVTRFGGHDGVLWGNNDLGLSVRCLRD